MKKTIHINTHTKPQPILLAVLLSAFFVFHSDFATAQTDMPVRKNEIQAGAGMSMYQLGYATQINQQIEVAYSRVLTENLKAAAGFRYFIKPSFPAGFARLSLYHRFGAWKPSIGVEMGFSNAKFTYSDKLLQEIKVAMTDEMGQVYLSTHMAPLCFEIGEKWNISALEINVGSHVKYTGRTVFVQLNFLNLAHTF